MSNLRTAFDLANRSTASYYSWVRQMVTIATAALTLLTTFRRTLAVPGTEYVWILHACWVMLSASIALGVLVLHGEQQTLLDLANRFRAARDTPPSESVEGLHEMPRIHYKIAGLFFPWTLVAALILLTSYAIIET